MRDAVNKDMNLMLFDVDGTLTEPRLPMGPDIASKLDELRALDNCHVGIVGGSNLIKQEEQLGEECYKDFNWFFSENGLVAFKDGKEFHRRSIVDEFSEDFISSLLDYILLLISRTNIPKKRGTFVEFRTGMINISPIGRSCSYEERLEFFEFDKANGIREEMINELNEFYDDALDFSIGGQISIDIYPKGWDKTYCLRHLKDSGYKDIYFFGDKTEPNGNDHALFINDAVEGTSVSGPLETADYIYDMINNFKAML
jgi:phosphomannomutase